MFWRLFYDKSEDWQRMQLRYGQEGEQYMLTKGWVRMRATMVLLISVFLFAYGCSGDTTAKKMAFVQRGDAYFADGKYAEAILEFKNAIQLAPENAQAHYKLGLSLLKRGSGPADLQEAFHSISKSVQFDATNLEAQLTLGEFFLLSRKFAKRPF
jgi:tetratricopeptide (TPR) repeat protein